MSIFRFDVIGHVDIAKEFRNIHHYEFDLYVPSVTEMQEVIDAIDAAYKSNFQAHWPNEIGIDSYETRRVDIAELPSSVFVATAGAFLGTGTSDPMPKQTAQLVTFHSPTVFPRTTRTYLPAPTELQSGSNGEPSGTWLTAVAVWADAMFTHAVTGQLDPEKQAVEYTGVPRKVTLNNDVETRTVKAVWAFQRRRRVGI